MLLRLSIRDFVLVERLELEFGAGFSALTGETGAGKSILVDALGFALGERTDTGIIRTGCERAEVSAEFDLSAQPEALAALREQQLDDGTVLLLRRVVDAGGRSRGWINGTPSPLQTLREVAEALVDIHGQHAHQSLLRPEMQRRLLDQHAGLGAQVTQVAAAWQHWQTCRRTLAEATSGHAELADERERLSWEVEELEALDFTPALWEELNAEQRRLAHAAGLIDGARTALEQIADGEPAAAGLLGHALARLDGLAGLDPELDAMASLLRSAEAELAEAGSALRRYLNRADLDPQRLEAVEQRQAAILDCARKYRLTPATLPQRLEAGRARLQALGAAADLAGLQQSCAQAEQVFRGQAAGLSAARQQAAATLAAEVSAVMQDLALAGGRLVIALPPLAEGCASGCESVLFQIAHGEAEARPLARVASGGELSRISLAIQVVTSRAAAVPTLLFDEVDVGIGGGVAEVVGRLLRRLGKDRQVLCVTHLPQVAACADRQWQVSKAAREGSDGNRTWCSLVLELNAAGRIEELARMLGGVEITPITRRHAEEMLARSTS